MFSNVTMVTVTHPYRVFLSHCQVRSFNVPAYSQTVSRLHYCKHKCFPRISTIFFCFYWLWKTCSWGFKYRTIQNTRSAITRKLCIEFRVPKVTPVCFMFLKIFLQQLSWIKKLCQPNMTPANNYVPKERFLFQRRM